MQGENDEPVVDVRQRRAGVAKINVEFLSKDLLKFIKLAILNKFNFRGPLECKYKKSSKFGITP